MADARHDESTVRIAVEAPPPRVLAAFVEPERRRRWIRMPGSGARYEDDVRVGGTDVATRTFRLPTGDQRLENRTTHLLVSERRLVHAVAALVDDATEVRWTEQVSFLVPSERPEDDLAHVRGGTRLRLNGLAAAVAP
ncbi:SRPBCC family protein [Amnibacterium setariae]|uniref:Uncharacterized protein n=1 Tax=Amnibacterium setariae TaxID=2306585 RepID=A0A3A1U518_9MICO|nr:hypothetical protein [Amnibacterium setariae]RIX30118.1 hypothetical protein D1781_01275 [Amnibacterium setariae]